MKTFFSSVVDYYIELTLLYLVFFIFRFAKLSDGKQRFSIANNILAEVEQPMVLKTK